MVEAFSYVWMIPVFPLIGTILNLFLIRSSRTAGLIASASVGVAFLIAVNAFFDLTALPENARSIEVVVYSWINSGTLSVDVGFLIDPLSCVMMLVITGVGFLIHVYSIGYMAKDPGCVRYFSYLNLFTFAMLLLVMSNNFLLMFVGWEGVGLCSYLLIGFWYERVSAANAGMKAFVVNRIGDFAFLLGMLLIFVYTGSLTFSAVFSNASALAPVVTVATLLLFIGATGKSAQLPLHVWLPDAMEGPTPVSALIHAATMVTAGVYMIARLHLLYVMAPTTLMVIAVTGALTAIFAASIGLSQFDIKRVLAYSTVSQLGYMFLACGVGFFSAGVFHLVTHAFFKALLFMGAGSVIHAMEHAVGHDKDPQDLRYMGGLKDKMPTTYKTMLIATLALSGIPPFAGFFSKDSILWGAFVAHPLLWGVGVLAAFMTAFYMFRLVFLTFHGTTRLSSEQAGHIHEAPKLMTVPLLILAVLSLVGGLIGIPELFGHGLDRFGDFLQPVFADLPAHETGHAAAYEWLTLLTSVVIAVVGIAYARKVYVVQGMVPGFDEPASGLHRLSLHKYYIDELYSRIIIKPIEQLAWVFWKIIDLVLIDGILTIGALMVKGFGSIFRYTQTGVVQNYALIMVLGAVIVLGYLVM